MPWPSRTRTAIAAHRNIAGDPQRVASLGESIATPADRYLSGGRMQWQYLQAVMTMLRRTPCGDTASGIAAVMDGLTRCRG